MDEYSWSSDERRVIERPHQLAPALEQLEQPLVIDVEPKRACRRIEVGPVNEKTNLLLWGKFYT